MDTPSPSARRAVPAWSNRARARPSVVVDRLEVAAAAVGEDGGAAAARGHERGGGLEGERDAARRAAGQDRLPLREPAAADDAVEIGDANELVEVGGRRELGLDTGPETGHHAPAAHAAEERAARRVHGHEPRAAPALAQVVAAAAQVPVVLVATNR